MYLQQNKSHLRIALLVVILAILFGVVADQPNTFLARQMSVVILSCIVYLYVLLCGLGACRRYPEKGSAFALLVSSLGACAGTLAGLSYWLVEGYLYDAFLGFVCAGGTIGLLLVVVLFAP